MQADNDTTETPRTASPATTTELEHLLSEAGEIFFSGLSQAKTTIPGPAKERMASDQPPADDEIRSFKEAVSLLPRAEKSDLRAHNPYADADAPQEPSRKVAEEMAGLDVDALEDVLGTTVAQAAAGEDAAAWPEVDGHADVVDPRRQLLAALGADVKFRWQIASDSYEPGDMERFYLRKLRALQGRGFNDAWGRIDYHDWGGAVSMTTVYPSLQFSITIGEQDINPSAVAPAATPQEKGAFSRALSIADVGDDDEISVLYGDVMTHDYRGAQTINAQPIIYVPATGTTIPLPQPSFSRRHQGNFMDRDHERSNDRKSPLEWHESILDRLESLTGTINGEIVRARLLTLDFTELPFQIRDFYRYAGISSEKVIERATTTARGTAEPESKPSLWTLQVSLKVALLKEFSGNRSGQAFKRYQQVAGKMLRNPASQFKLIAEEHNYATEDTAAPDQQTDAGVDTTDLNDLTEVDIDLTTAGAVEQNVQEELAAFGNGDSA
ncbi:hypothetical protein RYH80_18315 [Halobaculum sp. MBLA0147]|uniref:hypothetical protein n=1 Tax=Halobaculum sp. MBLA0147 TaxID=3079934 RepID=UPI003524DD15